MTGRTTGGSGEDPQFQEGDLVWLGPFKVTSEMTPRTNFETVEGQPQHMCFERATEAILIRPYVAALEPAR